MTTFTHKEYGVIARIGEGLRNMKDGGPLPSTMEIICITRTPHDAADLSVQFKAPATLAFDEGVGHLPMLERTRKWPTADIIGWLHDDLTVLVDGWQEDVLAQFLMPDVAVVGFGGALGLGHPDIYKLPYALVQLARYDYMSNQDDAERHGKRFEGACDVAVLDSFAIFIRREWLESVGGWPHERYAPSHMMDAWICLKAHETDKRVRMVGVACHHESGGRGVDYPAWAATTKYGSDEEMHAANHRLIYDDFRKCLPVRVEAPDGIS